MSGTRVGLLFGGRSVEHEVSVNSARNVARALGEAGLVCVPIGVTRDGQFLGADVSNAILESDAKAVEARTDDGTRLVIEPAGGLLERSPDGSTTSLKIDVLFPLIHGWGGEDGRLQGALDLARIPYVGCNVAASAVSMDKILQRRLLDAVGIPGVTWIEVDSRDHSESPDDVEREIDGKLRYPLFVKPANGGSSVGVSKVKSAEELRPALESAFECDLRAIVENGVDAREIECAVLGNRVPEASVLGEIVPTAEFYDYDAKYNDDTSELHIPADLEPALAQEIRDRALRAYRSLGLTGLARVDFLVERGSDEIYLNEINTLPGFTSISMFPSLWEASGLAYPRLVQRLVDLALERWQSEAGRERVES